MLQSQRWSSRGGRSEVRRHRVAGGRAMVGRTGARAEKSNLSTTARAAGLHTEAGREAAAVRNTRHPGPDGLRGHYQYYGRPTNSQSLLKFYRGVVRIWRKWLNRRTRGNRLTWERYTELLRRHPLLPPRIRHCLDVPGESCLRNPLREICTVESVREETSRWCHGEPKRARSWKRRTH